MKNKKITLLIILIGILFLIILKYFTYNVFSPNSGNFDDDKKFVDNQVYVYFYDDVSFFKIKWFLIRINGKLDAYEESIINSYAITLDRSFEDEEAVLEYCNILMDKYDIIEDCYSNGIIRIDNPINGEIPIQ